MSPCSKNMHFRIEVSEFYGHRMIYFNWEHPNMADMFFCHEFVDKLH